MYPWAVKRGPSAGSKFLHVRNPGDDHHPRAHPRGHGISLYCPSDGPVSSAEDWKCHCSKRSISSISLLLHSGPEFEPFRRVLGAQSLAPTPVTLPPPIRPDPPLQQILCSGSGVRGPGTCYAAAKSVGAKWPSPEFRSGPRTLRSAFAWACYPFPCRPLPSAPVIPSSPNRHDVPSLRIFFRGHGVSVQLVVVGMGSVVVIRLGRA